ncbi:efflux RND transporter periplasmic adaptor subunit [Thiomicrospira sp. R3]|uniref:efflux RND transporter periplasmic adaptor subunit n=1 Tax=Thiomicrospira sp. R3 TaxID=3035472 RepID=UPI00259AEEBD|nr:efflux RND transporter periplasmic adaptor subunit [Thiomicrospira sp. R3]WFE68728.1 efflux RND transporter periplasmic adaptor subunit [Thiomicrospira sp. R3]
MKRLGLFAVSLMMAFNLSAAEIKIGSLVSGQVAKLEVKEGQQVRAGQLIMTIDDRRYQAKLGVLEADLAYRQAALDDAKIEYEQVEDLYDRTVIARRPFERAKLDLELAQQAFAKAQAELALHQAWADYFYIKAPQAGRIKTLAVTQGSTVFNENQLLFILEAN